ncbi:MAG: hypothetical protein R2851_07260 [Caldilineaceae bacterium]
MHFGSTRATGAIDLAAPDVYTQLRLPLDFPSLTRVADHFYVKPLLPLLTDDGRFYILALSQNDVRLYQATHTPSVRLAPEGIPRRSRKRCPLTTPSASCVTTRVRAGTGNPITVGAPPSSMATPRAPDDEKATLRRYLRQVDDGLMAILEGAHRRW